VPAGYAALFRGRTALLRSHRGWDPGALDVARSLSRSLAAPLVSATTTRLLVDLNRSPHNRAIFSAHTRDLSNDARAALIEHVHEPHWERVRRALDDALAAAGPPVVHVAVHSFTPRLDGRVRDFELGLLYDPARGIERRFALAWRSALRARAPSIRVRLNAPYRGNADGLTTAMRRERGGCSDASYVGLELELNQRIVRTQGQRRALTRILAPSLREVLDQRGSR
jgi:predicted N-formylglutamate amidohydrolase